MALPLRNVAWNFEAASPRNLRFLGSIWEYAAIASSNSTFPEGRRHFVSDHAVIEIAHLPSSRLASLPAPCPKLLRSGPIFIYGPLWRNRTFDRTWNSAWLWKSNISTTYNWFTYRCLSNSCRIFVRSADTGIFNEYICWISGAYNIGQLSNEYSTFAACGLDLIHGAKSSPW